jgi:hypothetical protein
MCASSLSRRVESNRVIRADFLSLRPQNFDPYDLVVMNPPFDRERDVDHVTHALEFLKPGGQLFAIMSAGTEFRETRKAIAFRALVERHRGSFRDLPPGSFRESGTNVNTIILTMRRSNAALPFQQQGESHDIREHDAKDDRPALD